MSGVADRLQDLRAYKIRARYVEDRLYGIDGKAYELEDLLKPGSYQKFWMEELRERQASIEAEQENLRIWAHEEERRLLALIEQLRSSYQKKVLRLYFIETKSITETAAAIYQTEIEAGRVTADFVVPRIVRAIQVSCKNLEAIQAALEVGGSGQRQAPCPGEK